MKSNTQNTDAQTRNMIEFILGKPCSHETIQMTAETKPCDLLEYIPMPSRIIHPDWLTLKAGVPSIQALSGLESIPVHADWSIGGLGLPDGLKFDQGCISGVPTRAGEYDVTMTARYDGEAAEIRAHLSVKEN